MLYDAAADTAERERRADDRRNPTCDAASSACSIEPATELPARRCQSIASRLELEPILGDDRMIDALMSWTLHFSRMPCSARSTAS
jgi:hypothetical protein